MHKQDRVIDDPDEIEKEALRKREMNLKMKAPKKGLVITRDKATAQKIRQRSQPRYKIGFQEQDQDMVKGFQ